MKYEIDPKSLKNMFALPGCVADEHLKLAPHSALKVLIYIMRNSVSDEAEICKAAGVNEVELKEALMYWDNAGVLMRQKQPEAEVQQAAPAVNKPTVPMRNERATRAQIARRADESKEIRLVLQQAEMKFCRPLKDTERSALVYILDELGVSAPVTLMLIEYAVAENRTTAAFLESTAVDWVNRSVDTVALAEKEMQRSDQKNRAWSVVRSAVGLDDRRPSAKEGEACVRWTVEWGFSGKMIRLAYDQCVDNTGKISFPYMNKVLKSWHDAGVTTPEAVAASAKKNEADKSAAKAGSAPSFDLSLF